MATFARPCWTNSKPTLWKLFPTRTNQVKLGKIRLFGVVRIVFSVMTNMPTYILSTTFNSDIPLHRQSFSRGSTVLLFISHRKRGIRELLKMVVKNFKS